MEELTPDLIGSVAGIVLSLAFSYVPGLKQRYEALTGEWKRVIMAALLFLVAVAIFGLGCADILAGTCSRDGAMQVLRVFIAALVANQGTYLLAGSRERNWHVYTTDDMDELTDTP